MTSASVRNGLEPAIAGCLEACHRCEVLIDCVTGDERVDDAGVYRAIGPHLRHCVDHFTCLFRGLESGVVDYDARDREELLERDAQHFRRTLASIVQQLRAIGPDSSRRVLRVRQAVASDGLSIVVESNLERELVFLSGHTIHHLAIMRLLAEARGLFVTGNLDVAYSTEAHDKQVVPRTG